MSRLRGIPVQSRRRLHARLKGRRMESLWIQFALCFGVLALAVGYRQLFDGSTSDSIFYQRSLLAASDSDVSCSNDFDQNGGIVAYFYGALFLFVGLALICDDYFVSSLEKISETLNLSEDVAGATFMAAGSSAPELFTSIMAVFGPGNEIGVGTIVGSAVFNILVIIGATAMLCGQILLLDYRPLFRDCICYVTSVVFLVVTFEDGKVELWEALVLLIGYALYIVLMYFNPWIMSHTKLPAHLVKKRGSAMTATVSLKDQPVSGKPGSFKDADVNYEDDSVMDESNGGADSGGEGGDGKIKRVISQKDLVSMRLHAAHDAVAHPGQEHHVQIPTEGGGTMHRSKSRESRVHPGTENSEEAAGGGLSNADPILAGLGSDEDLVNSIAQDTRRKSSKGKDTSAVGSGVGENPNQSKDGENNKDATDRAIDIPPGDEIKMEDKKAAANSSDAAGKDEADKGEDGKDGRDGKDGKDGEGEGEDDAEDDDDKFEWPESVKGWLFFVLFTGPFQLIFYVTVPNCGKKKWETWYVATFCISILWISFLTYFMVEWASKIGCILEVDVVVMGLIFLAAGTSVPDALGSIIVAKDGFGDMAVSNAIGSNVFDILLGLGFPFFLYNLIEGEAFLVDKDSILEYTFILLGIVVLMLSVLFLKKWHLDKPAGIIFLVAYLIFFSTVIVLTATS